MSLSFLDTKHHRRSLHWLALRVRGQNLQYRDQWHFEALNDARSPNAALIVPKSGEKLY